ncbi:MAG TPA: hypothetical protein VKB93_19730 [Thermoanaerobaculia bacterium]|nr:hypothetical protein [Thermoanaerobaculia bacterium]
MEGLDNVNLFNGTMNLNVPIGQTYYVGGTLSYSFMASYATNPWQTGYNETDYGDIELPDDPIPPMLFNTYQFPAKPANAGLGWTVTLGQLLTVIEGELPMGTYLAPDGGHHDIAHPMHGLGVLTGDAIGSSDGTYIRRRVESNQVKLDFPDGNVHTFDAQGRLIGMSDQFGNTVTVTYSREASPHPEGGERTVQKIEDSTGRVHYIYWRRGWNYYEDRWEAVLEPKYRIPHEVVDKIVLAAFTPANSANQTAEYKFNYDASYQVVDETAPANPALTTSRPCANRHDGHTPPYVYVPILTSIDMPEGVRYAFTTDRGDHLTCRPVLDPNASGSMGSITGHITRLTLPTGSTIEWEYQVYGFPAMSLDGKGSLSAAVSLNPGVRSRVVKSGGQVLGRTEYFRSRLGDASSYTWDDHYRIVKNYDKDDVLLNATAHYFSACRHLQGCPGRYQGEYGLPFSRQKGTAGGGFVSTELLAPDDFGNLAVKRTTYLRYENDASVTDGASSRVNSRPAYERTVYEDGRYSEVTYSDWDGLGHYRRTETGGDFERENGRVTFVNYNPSVGTYELENGHPKSTYRMLTAADVWNLNTYDRQWTAEQIWSSNGAGGWRVTDTTACFDPLGFQRSRRVHKIARASLTGNPIASSDDLLTIFVRDANSRGNVASEYYYGGTASVPEFVCAAPNPPPAGETYRIRNSYQYGALASSWYTDASDNPLSFFIKDRVIDRNTGAVAASRQFRLTSSSSGGVTTTYAYDKLGRVKSVEMPRLRTDYGYIFTSSATSPMKITTTSTDATGMVAYGEAHFDGLGRQIKETRAMPGGVTAEKVTTYNALGWITSSIDWGATAPTETSYDAFGRPVSIKAPDVSAADAAKIAYSGVAQTRRSAMVKTGGRAGQPLLTRTETIEDFDRHGRLIRVTEPPASIDTTARTVTEYFYDNDNHMIEVCANRTAPGSTGCGQARTFSYDGRGFLTREWHVESEPVNYLSYDARGHLLRRQISAGVFDLEFSYDRAERLFAVDERAGAAVRPNKSFTFHDTNPSATGANGQLKEGVRYNWLPDGRTIKVAESYTYNTEGRVESKTTADYRCQGTSNCVAQRRFEQRFAYDALGNTTTLSVPTDCPLTGCTSPLPTAVTNVYERGWLTSVTWAGGVSSIAYHPSGLPARVTHPNRVVDEIKVDPAVPSRPSSMITSLMTFRSLCVPPSFTRQPGSTTIADGGSAPLSVAAVGETGRTITYTWYLGEPPNRSKEVASGTSFNAAPALTTTYWVEAKNDCGATVSQSVKVTVCTKPTVTDGSDNKTITRGMSTRLTMFATGSNPLSYQWYKIVGADRVALPNGTASNITVSPAETTAYVGVVTNSCGSANRSVTITVVAPATVPTAVSAAYRADLGGVLVTWGASTSVAGIAGYLVERQPDGISFRAEANARSFLNIVDPANPAGAKADTAYTFTVRALDAHGFYSEASPRDFAVTVDFAGSVVALTPVKSEHIRQLRKAAGVLRVLAGLSAAWTSNDPSTVAVISKDLYTIRDAVNQARVTLGFEPLVFSEPPGAQRLIRASCIRELQDALR